MSTPSEKWVIPLIHSPLLFSSPLWSCSLDFPSAEILVRKGNGSISFDKVSRPLINDYKALIQPLYDKMPVLRSFDYSYVSKFETNQDHTYRVLDLINALFVIGNKAGKYDYSKDSLCRLFFSMYGDRPYILSNRLHALVFGGAFFQGDPSTLEASRLYIPSSLSAYYMQSEKPIVDIDTVNTVNSSRTDLLVMQYCKAVELGHFELATGIFTENFLKYYHFNPSVGIGFAELLIKLQCLSFSLDKIGMKGLLFFPSSIQGDALISSLSGLPGVEINTVKLSREGIHKA